MSHRSWVMVLVALVVGAAAAVAITNATEEEQTAAAPPAQDSTTEKPKAFDEEGKSSAGEGKEKAGDEQAAQQDVEGTVDAYLTALEEGDTEALCDIQAQSLTVKVTASGVSGDEIAEACAEAVARIDWVQLWAEWASAVNLDDVHVTIDGVHATASLTAGASFTLNRERSGEWKIDGFNPPGAGGPHSGPRAPQGGGASGGHDAGLPGAASGGGGLPGGGADVPSGGGIFTPQLPGR